MDCASDSDGSIDLSWLSDKEDKLVPPHIHRPSNGPFEEGASSSSLMPHFLAMGFPENMVEKAIKENDDGNSEAILELLLTYSALDDTPSGNEENTLSDENDRGDDDLSDMDDFEDVDFGLAMAGQASNSKEQILVTMGFSQDEAMSAIERCGEDANVLVLVDSICAARTADQEGTFGEHNASNADEKHGDQYDPFLHNNKRQRCLGRSKGNNTQRFERLKRAYSRRPSSSCHDEVGDRDKEINTNLPNPMVGFGLPIDPGRQLDRDLPTDAQGPPYFYYENVARTPEGVWDTFSRFLGIAPEFVDSKYFSTASRKRGYIHNLPIRNRFQLEPVPPKTILNAFTSARAYWPAWDTRTHFNCILTVTASAKQTGDIRTKLVESPSPPPETVIKSILAECRKWNLIWVGQNRVAQLEPDEVEFLLGFPRNHTRGFTRKDRYRSLGNSFQVDTVAYHLSVLKEIYPNGIKVLSLFSGIGGAEVSLHRLGIKMIAVLSVEISQSNRTILRSWWDQTQQTGVLEEIDDVQCVDDAVLERFVARHGNFDLVIGGSPCNNLSGSNRLYRVGLKGEHSSLFFHYYRILERVRELVRRH